MKSIAIPFEHASPSGSVLSGVDYVQLGIPAPSIQWTRDPVVRWNTSPLPRIEPESLTFREAVDPDNGLDATHIALAEAVSSLTLRLDATDAALAHAAEDEWRAEWRGRLMGAACAAAVMALAWGLA